MKLPAHPPKGGEPEGHDLAETLVGVFRTPMTTWVGTVRREFAEALQLNIVVRTRNGFMFRLDIAS